MYLNLTYFQVCKLNLSLKLPKLIKILFDSFQFLDVIMFIALIPAFSSLEHVTRLWRRVGSAEIGPSGRIQLLLRNPFSSSFFLKKKKRNNLPLKVFSLCEIFTWNDLWRWRFHWETNEMRTDRWLFWRCTSWLWSRTTRRPANRRKLTQSVVTLRGFVTRGHLPSNAFDCYKPKMCISSMLPKNRWKRPFLFSLFFFFK